MFPFTKNEARRSAMSRLRSVIRHEYLTIIRQPSFWIVMIAIPLIIAVVIGLNYLSNKTGSERIEEVAQQLQTVAIIDQSELINKEVVTQSGLQLYGEAELDARRDAVRSGDSQALIVFPENLASARSYQLYVNGTDITTIGAVGSLADSILKTSLFLPLGSAEVISLAQNGASSTITFFEDGQETAGFNAYIAPGLFVLLFYIIFAFSVGYMLTSISEEKENRSMEMVLTYVKPRTLIIGKLLGVSLVTLTQITFFALMAGIAYIVAQQTGGFTLPFGLDLSKMVIEPVTIILAASYLIVGFLMYAGFMTSVAAMAPSAKEANNFSTVFFIGAFVPFYFVMMLITDPENPISTFLTYFPLTSPVVTLIRNAVGNMDPFTAWTSLAVMTIFMILSIAIAVRAFRLGALEFAQTLKLTSLFKR